MSDHARFIDTNIVNTVFLRNVYETIPQEAYRILDCGCSSTRSCTEGFITKLEPGTPATCAGKPQPVWLGF